MDSNTGVLGEHQRKHKEPLFAKIIAAILCLILLLLSLMLVNIRSHTANADNDPSSLGERKSPTPTRTSSPSPTPSPTATFSPSPTAIPTKTPTATPSPAATATRPAPTLTPTRGVTSTATVTPSPAASVIPTSGGNQTPSPISAMPRTTNGGDNSGGNGDGTPPALPLGGLFGLSLSSFIIGSLILLGIVGAIFFGLVMLRKQLLPHQTPRVNLPPSGARPWKRVRPESLNGITNAPGGEYFGPGSNIPGILFQSDGGGFPPSPPNTPPTTAYSAANSLSSADGFMLAADVAFDGVRPATLETKPLMRRVPSSIRLQAMESSGSQPAAYGLQQRHLDRNSEEMPSLDDPSSAVPPPLYGPR